MPKTLLVFTFDTWIQNNRMRFSVILLFSIVFPLLSFGTESDSAKFQGKLLNSLAFLESEDVSEAISSLTSLAQEAEKEKSYRFQILALNNIANAHLHLNQIDSAFIYYQTAMEIADENGLLNLKNTILNNLGILYSAKKEYEKSEACFDEAYATSVIMKDTAKMAINLVNSGSLAIQSKDYNRAKAELNRALQFYSAVNITSSLGAVYNSLGDIHYINQSYDSALFWYSEAQLQEPKSSKRDSMIYVMNIGKTLFQMDEPVQALNILEPLQIDLSHSLYYHLRIEVLRWLASIYEKQNQHGLQSQALEKCIVLQDSMIDDFEHKDIEAIELNYKYKAEQKNLKLEKEIEEQRIFYTRLIASILFIAFVAIIFLLYDRIKKQKEREELLAHENTRIKEDSALIQAKNESLNKAIEDVNYELMSQALLLENKTQIINSIQETLSSEDQTSTLPSKELKKTIKQHQSAPEDWNHFKVAFEKRHSNFFRNLHEQHPSLNVNDLKFAAYTLLQFDNKEIGLKFNISPDSVRKRRQRFRQKLDLSASVDLHHELLKYADN